MRRRFSSADELKMDSMEVVVARSGEQRMTMRRADCVFIVLVLFHWLARGCVLRELPSSKLDGIVAMLPRTAVDFRLLRYCRVVKHRARPVDEMAWRPSGRLTLGNRVGYLALILSCIASQLPGSGPLIHAELPLGSLMLAHIMHTDTATAGKNNKMAPRERQLAQQM